MSNSKILASVNGSAVTEEDVNQAIMSMGQRGQNLVNPQGRAMVLEQLVNRKLILAGARRELLETEPAFKAQLAQVKEELLTKYAIDKTIGGITVTESEAQKFFDENPERFESVETVNASHILVDSEDAANGIMQKINAGEISFEDAAKQYSSCPSKENGGNLGDFGRGQMVGEFDEAVFKMEENQLSGPVKTQFGYHIIKLNSKSDSGKLSFDEVKDQLKERLVADKQQKAYTSKINQLKILFPVDKY